MQRGDIRVREITAQKKCLRREAASADFVILGQNPFAVEAEKIREIPVEEVYAGGVKVWARE